MDRFVGTAVNRRENPRLLAGVGDFVANVEIPGALHAAFVRSPVGHGVVRSIDTSVAKGMPGVRAVFTATDLDQVVQPFAFTPSPALSLPSYGPLAGTKVRCVGDPVALVLASSLAEALDAAACVEVDIDLLPAVVRIDDALDAGSAPVWDELSSNLLFSDRKAFGDIEQGFASAAHVVRARLEQHRVSNAPLEPRGIIAAFDPRVGQLTVRTATQNPQMLRHALATALGLPSSDVRVVNGDIGGSFGQKGWVRPEDVAIAAASRAVGQPVRWIESRTENLTVGGHARDERADVEVALGDDGRILAIRCEVVLDQGAYAVPMSVRTGTLAIMRTLLPSVYDIRNYEFTGRLVSTNKGSYVTYRGPWAAETWFRERALDRAARCVGLDPFELRLRNLVDATEPAKMVTGPTLRALTIERSLRALQSHPIVTTFAERRAAARRNGKLMGLGVSVFIEPAPGPPDFFPSVGGFVAPPEASVVRMEPDGSVTVTITQTPSGQAHETTYAMVVADELGVPVDRVRVRHGDTSFEPFDYFGSGGSRSAQKTTGANRIAARAVRAKLLDIAASLLEANVDDLVIEDGRISVSGSPASGLDIARVATTAWLAPGLLPDGMTPGLSEVGIYDNADCPFSQGVHCCTVEIDPQTGSIHIDRYVVVEDCGEVINPEVVDDQIRGGVLQGIATVLYERHAFDEAGNLLTGSFVDYGLPSSVESPTVEIHHVHGDEPSTVPYRGVGEGGAIAAPAAVSNAIEDALSALGAEIDTLHVAPQDIVRLVAGRDLST